MKIQKSAEDYLEAMLMMQEKHGFIRSIDVSEHLGVTKPSVSYAAKRLRENGYINMDKNGLITLTEAGMEMVIANGEKPELLYDIVAGKPIGTRFLS